MKIVKLSKETNEIQRVMTLRESRNSRHRYQEFILEGRIAIDQAYAKGWEIKSLFYNGERPLSSWTKKHIAQKQYEIAYEVSPPLMEKIGDKTGPVEMLAIAKMQINPFSSFEPELSNVVVVLDSPKSSGNLGMMIRSCVAFKASSIVISGHAADEYDPKCIRASVGTFFSIPIYRVEGASKFIEKLSEITKTKKVMTIVSGDKGAIPIEEAQFDGDLLFLILGNETNGVSVTYRKIADQFVRISLPGEFTSLNIAAAGSIFLYEISRYRKTSL